MLTLTILWVPFVQGALAQDPTGTTAFSLAECLTAPASALPASEWSVQARPAAYGHLGLSQGAVGIHLADVSMVAALQGVAADGWTDLRGIVQHRWSPTASFVVGTMAVASWAGARGFASSSGIDVSIHSRILLDPTWSVVCGIDRVLQLHTRFQPPSQALRLGASWEGAVAAAAHLELTADHGTSAILQVAGTVDDHLRVRGTVVSSPITIAAASVVALEALPALTVELRWVADLGLRTSIAVDLP